MEMHVDGGNACGEQNQATPVTGAPGFNNGQVFVLVNLELAN